MERGRFYLGYVVFKRGAEELPGRHEAIIDEATWAVGRKAADARIHGRRERSARRRVYQLAGIIRCPSGHNLRGETKMSRGQEWRYYLCRECGKYSVPAAGAEAVVVGRLRDLVLPSEAVEEAREVLRRRLALPSRGLADESRAKIEKRIKNLKQL